jgi:hypothetical protein
MGSSVIQAPCVKWRHRAVCPLSRQPAVRVMFKTFRRSW